MRTVGSYSVLNRLASGSLADVFLARAADENDAQIALKIYKPEYATNLQFARLLVTESKEAVRYKHPILVRLLQVEREADELYAAMSFEPGQPLSALVRRSEVEGRPLSHPVICWIGGQIAQALDGAHQRPWFAGTSGVLVHGCLSPRSVLITYDGRVKLLGLGSGRARVTVETPMSRLPYQAPELLKSLPLTHRADVYALGVVLYDALSGKRIFRRGNPEATKTAIREARAPRLNSRDLQVAPEIGDLIAEMMAPRVDARPEALGPIAKVLLREAGEDTAALQQELTAAMHAVFQEELQGLKRLEGAAERATRSKSVIIDSNAGAQSAASSPAQPAKPAPRAESGTEPAFDIDVEAPVEVSQSPPQQLESLDIDVKIEEPVVVADPPAAQPGAEPSNGHELRAFPERPLKAPAEPAPPSAPAVSAPPSWTEDLESATAQAELHAIAQRDLPKRVGRYQVKGIVRSTSTARVLLGRDPNVARPVLLKVMSPSIITDPRLPKTEWIRLFKREARIVGGMSHPNLPILYDAGRDEVGYFIAYAPAQGDLLSDVLDQGRPLSQGRIREIVVDVAMALQYMHERNTMHCDIRSRGVLLSRDGRARLIDLSMACERGGPEHPLIASNIFVLPPEYFSEGAYSPRADQFALGQMLYRMLVGSRPFSGMDDNALVESIRTADPAPPVSLDPGLDPVLSKVCMRLLEKDPQARYDSAAAIVEQLLGVEEGAFESTRPTGDLGLPVPEPAAVTGPPGPPTLIDRPLTEIGYRPLELGPINTFDFGDALVALCKHVPQVESSTEGFDAPRAALGLARRARAPESTELIAGLTVALRDLAARSGVSVNSERMTPLIPEPLYAVFAEVDEVEPALDAPLVVQIVRVVEIYANAVAPGTAQRMSPRRAAAMLSQEAGKTLRPELVTAFIEHLRETQPGLSLTTEDANAPRLLVARRAPAHALVEALEYDGFAVEQASDGETAWSMLQQGPYDGVIVDDMLAGRDGLSLLRQCRATPSTANISFLILSSQPIANLEWEIQHAGDAEMVEGESSLDVIRTRVGRLLGRRAL